MIKVYKHFKINDRVICTYEGSWVICIGIILGDIHETIEAIIAINDKRKVIIHEFGWHSQYTQRFNPKYKPYNKSPRFIHGSGWSLSPLTINIESKDI